MLKLPIEPYNCTIRLLYERGYRLIFNLQDNKLHCLENKISLCSNEFDIHRMYYFPPDKITRFERMVYSIQSPQSGIKGIVCLNSAEGRNVFSEMMNKKIQECIMKYRESSGNSVL